MALEDLATAEKYRSDPEVPPRQACYLAQQAAEKIIKAALIQLQIEFPYTHDLDALLERLPDDWSVQREFSDLSKLSRFVVTGRYPGDWELPSTDEAKEAVDQARRVIEVVEIRLQHAE